METVLIILLLFAYTLGIITLFVQFICYSRKIEFKETLLLSFSFLLLLITVTIDTFLDGLDTKSTTPTLISLATILLGVSTLLNVLKERVIEVGRYFKKGLIGLALALAICVTFSDFFRLNQIIDYFTSGFLLSSVVYAMYLVRTTKPTSRIKHREKIERITALACIIVLPIVIVFDYFPEYVPLFQFNANNPLKLTLPFLFIFISAGKLIDDIKRLSLFKPEVKTSQQNLKNYNFTKRETEIIELLIKGSTYNQISESLYISLPTVKTHVSNIYRKAEVKNKIALINLLTA